ncbi:hypothetical protein HDU80_008527 [Chytriomyces hyalinus]|nr:hypothetical protein HDU80_008527 [Chytriomyces hyalinus]
MSLAENVAQLLQTLSSGSADEAAIVASIDAAIMEHTHAAVGQARRENEQLQLSFESLQKEHAAAITIFMDLQAQLDSTMISASRTREAMSEVEYERESLRLDVEKLSKEKSVLQQQQKELQERLQQETGNYEELKADWKSKEIKYLDTIKSQRRATRDVRLEVSEFQRTLSPERDTVTASRRASAINDEVQSRLLRSQITERDSKILHLTEKVTQLETAVGEMTKSQLQLKQQTKTLEKMNSELEQQNAVLKTENESYEVLLYGKTKNGEFVSLLHNNLDSSLGSEIVARGGDTDATPETPNEKQLKSEVKALTMYIDKILNKMMTNPEVAAILLMESDIDAAEKPDEIPPSPSPPSVLLTPSYLAPTSPSKNRSSFLAFPSAAIEMVRSVSGLGSSSNPAPPLPSNADVEGRGEGSSNDKSKRSSFFGGSSSGVDMSRVLSSSGRMKNVEE